MNRISDEQAEKIGKSVHPVWMNHTSKYCKDNIGSGHAAYAACEALTREQHAKEMLDLVEDDRYSDSLDTVIDLWDWDKVGSSVEQLTVRQMIRDGICVWAHNRLAKYIRKPDPAVEAVESVLREVRWIQGANPSSRNETILRIVAAVDAARKGGAKQ
jgi:hypothetical protein